MPGIFISYRRDDTAGHAGRLYDTLRGRFGDDRVVFDSNIPGGDDWFETIRGEISGARSSSR